ncbi:MAG: single-stranded DNA-binding protein [Lentisphaerae bacterium]|nr:single-stranded DNA-binding protein [Lentisphaerota bacterium]
MNSYNRVLMVGRLTRDPELRKIASGTSVASMSLALTDAFRNSAGERVEKTCYVDIESWGEQAENCAKYLRKGKPVLVEGKLQMDEWESKTGERRQKLKVRAQWIQYLGNGEGAGTPVESGGNGNGNGKRASQKPQPVGTRSGGNDEGEPPF